MNAWLQVKTGFGHLASEILRVLFQFIPQLRRFTQQVKNRDACPDDSWRYCIGKQVGTGALAQHLYDFFATGGEASGGAAQGFAQGAGDDIDAPRTSQCSMVPLPVFPTKPVA